MRKSPGSLGAGLTIVAVMATQAAVAGSDPTIPANPTSVPLVDGTDFYA
jgi:hypothetical protein